MMLKNHLLKDLGRFVNQPKRYFSNLPVSPYFALTNSINEIKSKYQDQATQSYAQDSDVDAFHSAPKVKTAG